MDVMWIDDVDDDDDDDDYDSDDDSYDANEDENEADADEDDARNRCYPYLLSNLDIHRIKKDSRRFI